MFSLLFDLASVLIGTAIPIFRTWRILKTRKTRSLVPLAKYWVVFGTTVSLDTIANCLCLPHLIPGYSLLKFVAILYTTIGYEHIYQKTISPLLRECEPKTGHLTAFCNFVWIRMTTTAGNVDDGRAAVEGEEDFCDGLHLQDDPD